MVMNRMKVKMPKMMREIASAIFKRPFTQRYPEVKVEVFEGFRGRQVFYPERCIGCGLCARDCPAEAIERVEVSGKKMPMFHLDRCIFCYICAENCPRNAIAFSKIFEMAAASREELVVKPTDSEATSMINSGGGEEDAS